jgi:hypothetical protein
VVCLVIGFPLWDNLVVPLELTTIRQSISHAALSRCFASTNHKSFSSSIHAHTQDKLHTWHGIAYTYCTTAGYVDATATTVWAKLPIPVTTPVERVIDGGQWRWRNVVLLWLAHCPSDGVCVGRHLFYFKVWGYTLALAQCSAGTNEFGWMSLCLFYARRSGLIPADSLNSCLKCSFDEIHVQ